MYQGKKSQNTLVNVEELFSNLCDDHFVENLVFFDEDAERVEIDFSDDSLNETVAFNIVAQAINDSEVNIVVKRNDTEVISETLRAPMRDVEAIVSRVSLMAFNE